MSGRTAAGLSCVAAIVVALLAPAADAQVEPYGFDNYCCFRDILPPGTNGLVDVAQLTPYETTGARPPHNNDQLSMYSNLTTAAPNIQSSQIGDYYKDSTFGVSTGDVERTETPEPGATIEWDSQFGVPHIYGDTRAELMFGIGWASAEDRLFFIDALRHAGQGDLAQFAGGANAGMDESVWQSEPYTHQDLVNQVDYMASHLPDGHQILSDLQNYVAGLNAYVSAAEEPFNALTMMPAEYAALGLTPQPFTVEDMVSIATLVGGIFGKGGGAQLSNAILYEQLERRFGPEHADVPGAPQYIRRRLARHAAAAHTPRASRRASRRARAADHSGFATFASFDDPNDPEAPTTVRGKSFPYQTLPLPTNTARGSVALPDPGSVRSVNPITAGALPSGGGGLPGLKARSGLLAFPKTDSNALLVSARHSTTGHPIEVMGPQVSYFTPEILMEEDIHGPGIDAAGAAFPGVNLYVELGHGTDYAWSATSAGQNIIDTFAVPLCNPAGGAAALDSDHYLIGHSCVQMQTLTDSESWQPNLADSTAAGSVTFTTERTAYGIVIARARVKGRAVAYCNLRSTYMHELDSAQGFEQFNEPADMRNPQEFMNAAYRIGYTFNWFYADDKHIAYFNSGLNPVRAASTNPMFPTWASFSWKGLHPSPAVTPGSVTEQQTAQSAHPQTVDQSFLTSWNNKQAAGYNDVDTGQEFSSVYRSQLLDLNIQHYLKLGHGKLTLTDLINAMGNAGTQDLRGVEVLPYALRIIGRVTGGSPLARAVSELRTWVATGAHRINRESPGPHGNYDQSDAVRIMDAWWPLLIRAEFQPVLGPKLLAEVESNFAINDEPGHGTSGSHLGSAFDVGFYGIVQKDLRAALGLRVRGALNRIYCGSGSRRRCRAALESSLLQAAAVTPDQVYPADGVCAAGDQMCSDSIKFRAIGAISQPLIEWVNRPTFQQADEIMGHGPR